MFAGHSMLCPYDCKDKGANREIGVPRLMRGARPGTPGQQTAGALRAPFLRQGKQGKQAPALHIECGAPDAWEADGADGAKHVCRARTDPPGSTSRRPGRPPLLCPDNCKERAGRMPALPERGL